MPILIIVPDRDNTLLKAKIEKRLNHRIPVWIYPNVPDPDAVQMAVVWKHPYGVLQSYPNLKLVNSYGAGVEHMLNDPAMPKQVTLARIVGESLSTSMTKYVLMAVLMLHRKLLSLKAHQAKGLWEKPAIAEVPMKIGILGLGALGKPIAQQLKSLGFEVIGYRRTSTSIAGIPCYSPTTHSLQEFTSRVNVLINLLPLTDRTKNILNLDLFEHLIHPAYLINVARGGHLVESDLLEGMKRGWIEHAVLDVFQEEPLPAGHPFWKHPKVTVTPHIASVTNQAHAAEIIADNYERMERGEEVLFGVDLGEGY